MRDGLDSSKARNVTLRVEPLMWRDWEDLNQCLKASGMDCVGSLWVDEALAVERSESDVSSVSEWLTYRRVVRGRVGSTKPWLRWRHSWRKSVWNHSSLAEVTVFAVES